MVHDRAVRSTTVKISVNSKHCAGLADTDHTTTVKCGSHCANYASVVVCAANSICVPTRTTMRGHMHAVAPKVSLLVGSTLTVPFGRRAMAWAVGPVLHLYAPAPLSYGPTSARHERACGRGGARAALPAATSLHGAARAAACAPRTTRSGTRPPDPRLASSGTPPPSA